MPHAPEEGLTSRDPVNAESDGDAQHVYSVEERSDHTITSLDVR